MTALPAPLDLSSETCTCRAYLHGAHLVDWTPAGREPVLWLSGLTHLDSAAAIRGGVPLVFPWFGSGVQGSMRPAHGFGRLSDWRLASVDRAARSVTAAFTLDSRMATSNEFPHDYEARYVIVAGERLELELTVVNTGAVPFTFEQAFHTYLAVGDVGEVTVAGLEGAEYLDQVSGPAEPHPVQTGAITLGTEIDRVYRSTAAVRVVDPIRNRVLVIDKTGSRSTIVWNPGAARAAEPKAADIGPDHWREFVCVETGNVKADAVTLGPSEASTMTCVLSVAPLG